METPISGMTVQPDYCSNPIMAGAFVGFVRMNLGLPEARDAFKKETGNDLDALVSGSKLDQMVDEATGRPQQMIAQFADWIATNHW